MPRWSHGRASRWRGPLRLPVAEWIAQQLEQPTYINMSGCITQLASFQALRGFPIAKPGGMRIEMATAAAPNNLRRRGTAGTGRRHLHQ